ncbi:MAG: hypothetical protein AAGF91_17095, partial [Actinomycetota bacterium]
MDIANTPPGARSTSSVARSRRRIAGVALLAGSALTVALVPSIASTQQTEDGSTIYVDDLENGFQDWSWAETDTAWSGASVSGTSIRADLGPWGGLSLGRPAPLDVSDESAVQFSIHGGGADVVLRVQAMDGSYRAGPIVPITATRRRWSTFTIPLADLGITDRLGGIWWMEGTGTDPRPIQLDDVRLVSATPAVTTIPPTTIPPTTVPPTTIPPTTVPAITTTTVPPTTTATTVPTTTVPTTTIPPTT